MDYLVEFFEIMLRVFSFKVGTAIFGSSFQQERSNSMALATVLLTIVTALAMTLMFWYLLGYLLLLGS